MNYVSNPRKLFLEAPYETLTMITYHRLVLVIRINNRKSLVYFSDDTVSGSRFFMIPVKQLYTQWHPCPPHDSSAVCVCRNTGHLQVQLLASASFQSPLLTGMQLIQWQRWSTHKSVFHQRWWNSESKREWKDKREETCAASQASAAADNTLSYSIFLADFV